MNALLTPAELEALLRYPRGRVTKLAREGLLPYLSLPDGELRFDWAVIERMINGRSASGVETASAP